MVESRKIWTLLFQFNDTNEDIIGICVLRHLKKRAAEKWQNLRIDADHSFSSRYYGYANGDVSVAANYFRELEIIITLFMMHRNSNGKNWNKYRNFILLHIK